VVIEGESCVLALLYSNTTFRLTSIKLFYIGDIEASSKGPKDDLEYYSKGEGDTGMIPPTILPILLKCSRGRPYKNPDIIVFL
jgi:hypothetical protein